jgi:hypothetical protein
MVTCEDNHDRIAQWLDGQPVELTDAERLIADEIQRDLALLEAPVDPLRQRVAMDHARRQLSAELARPTRRKRWLAVITSTEALAVAALLVVAWLTHVVVVEPNRTHDVDDMIQVVTAPEVPDRIDLLQDELDALRTEMMADLDGANTHWDIESLRHELNSYWSDDMMEIWFKG